MTLELYVAALLLTVLVETFVVLALVPELRGDVLVVVPLLNLCTHPLATLALGRYGLGFLPVEAGVTLLEALGLAVLVGLGARRSLWVATAANGTTAALALFCRLT